LKRFSNIKLWETLVEAAVSKERRDIMRKISKNFPTERVRDSRIYVFPSPDFFFARHNGPALLWRPVVYNRHAT